MNLIELYSTIKTLNKNESVSLTGLLDSKIIGIISDIGGDSCTKWETNQTTKEYWLYFMLEGKKYKYHSKWSNDYSTITLIDEDN